MAEKFDPKIFLVSCWVRFFRESLRCSGEWLRMCVEKLVWEWGNIGSTGDAVHSPAPLGPKDVAAHPLESSGQGVPLDPLYPLPSVAGVMKIIFWGFGNWGLFGPWHRIMDLLGGSRSRRLWFIHESKARARPPCLAFRGGFDCFRTWSRHGGRRRGTRTGRSMPSARY